MYDLERSVSREYQELCLNFASNDLDPWVQWEGGGRNCGSGVRGLRGSGKGGRGRRRGGEHGSEGFK